MFRGISAINLDSKGRLAIPTRYRTQLQSESHDHLIMTIETEVHCLLLYPLLEWEIIETKLQRLPSFNPVARRIQRLLIGHATELDLDNQSRILIPPLLREYAQIQKRIMLVGQGKKFEIWDEQMWQQCREKWLDEELNQAEDVPDEIKTLSL